VGSDAQHAAIQHRHVEPISVLPAGYAPLQDPHDRS
jgi:hypothetical protein